MSGNRKFGVTLPLTGYLPSPGESAGLPPQSASAVFPQSAFGAAFKAACEKAEASAPPQSAIQAAFKAACEKAKASAPPESAFGAAFKAACEKAEAKPKGKAENVEAFMARINQRVAVKASKLAAFEKSRAQAKPQSQPQPQFHPTTVGAAFPFNVASNPQSSFLSRKALKSKVRHRKVLRDNIMGITKSAIKRMFARAGITRASGLMYEEVRGTIKQYMERVIRDAVALLESERKRVLTEKHIVEALRLNGTTLLGY